MTFNNPHRNDSTIAIKVMCAIVFCLFSFLWLYWFQADILSIAQHILSGKQTHYNRLIGAVVITATLFAVQQIISKLIRLSKHSYALTYVPSMLLLGILGDVYPAEHEYFTHQMWFLILPVFLLIWGGAIWVIKQIYNYDDRNERTRLSLRQVWINLLELCCMMFVVALFSNTNAVTHYHAHAEKALHKGEIEEALRTGSRSDENDVNLTMLRMYALSLNNQLGDRLFEYPIDGTSKDVLPLGGQGGDYPYLISRKELFKHFGATPIAISSPTRYFELLEKDSLATKAVKDYKLCGLLIDKKINEFVELLPQYYEVGPSLPRHYKEALILYTHLRKNPILEFHESSMDENWKNFLEIKNSEASYQERKGILNEYYPHSYWFYYYFD